MQVLEALKGEYELYLITSSPFDLADFNSFYQTNVNSRDVRIKVIKRPFPIDNKNIFSAIVDFRISRYCKRVSGDFDIMFSLYNAMDFGRRGIQYIIDPNFNSGLLSTLDSGKSKYRRIFHRESLFRSFYLRISNILSGFSFEGMKKNLTICDSGWTAKLTEKYYSLKTKTIYPPVQDNITTLPFSGRENGFVCLGRVSSDKRVDRIIEIIKRLRSRGLDLHLHIVGKAFNESQLRQLKSLVSEEDKIFFEGLVSNQRKNELIGSHKFGIHGKPYDPFGIAIAEMVKSGCIVWVPDGGGQREIVNHDELMYKSIDDAVEKIESVLKDEVKQNELLLHLSKQAEKFSIERFKEEIRMTVKEFLS